jgi:hypothetical protein
MKKYSRFNQELYHHGVKGQQWGVRNGPPYPIEDPILKAGTRLNSVSSTYTDSEKYRNNGKWMYTYRADDAWDNKVYKGPFAKFLALYRGARFVKEHQYETVSDLKMPTKKQRIEEFKQIDNKKLTNDLKYVRNLLVSQNIGSAKEQENYKKIDLDNIKTEEDWRIAYDIFSHAMEASWMYKSTKEYMNRMSKKYDAMVDDNNQGIYNNAHDPIIIFRANKVLKSIGSDPVSSYLTWTDINDNTEYLRNELAKEGRNVRL